MGSNKPFESEKEKSNSEFISDGNSNSKNDSKNVLQKVTNLKNTQYINCSIYAYQK